MQPNFAIHFSDERAQILHLSGNGNWYGIGEAPTDGDAEAANSPEASVLRQRMARLGGWTVCTKLVIPNSFIWYTTCLVDGQLRDEIANEVSEHLGATTPFRIDELGFDWYADGDRARIAYVLRQNLAEAEEFAMNWGFNPVSFEADPPANSVFERQAFFGLTEFARRCGFSEQNERFNLATASDEDFPATEARIADRRKPDSGRLNWRRWLMLPVLALISIILLPFAGTEAAGEEFQPRTRFAFQLPATGGSGTDIRRLAQAATTIDLGTRPVRRPTENTETIGGREDASGEVGLQEQDATGAASALTFIEPARGTPEAEPDPARVFVDRGFNPNNVNNEVLERFQVGLLDTVQTDMIARIRQAAVTIDGFDAVRPQAQPEPEPEPAIAEATPDKRPGVSGSSTVDVREGLTAILTGNTGPEPETPTETPETDKLVASIAEDGNQLDGSPALPDEPPTESQTASAAPQAPIEFNIPSSAPPRRSNSVASVRTEAPPTDTRTASATPVERPTESNSEGQGIVVSQANETILIDDSGPSLIGIYGPASQRRALIRLATGSFASLYVGADFKGGKVVEISGSAVIYEVNSKRFQLTLP